MTCINKSQVRCIQIYVPGVRGLDPLPTQSALDKTVQCPRRMSVAIHRLYDNNVVRICNL